MPQRERIENPSLCLQTTIEPSKPQQREMLLDALFEISDMTLLRYYVDSGTHEIILSFLGKVQMEVTCCGLQEKYHVEIEIKEPDHLYGKTVKKSRVYHSHRSSTESCSGLHWSNLAQHRGGVQYESSVSWTLNQSFKMQLWRVCYGCEQVVCWNVTDIKSV